MKLQLPGKKTRYWQVFWLCLLAAAALCAPHCLVDAVAGGGYFHYAGDFNDQQINFYQYANSFIKQGGSFSWATDLGSGFVNSYSFYLLGSPFFWLTLLVPARFMPWMLVPLLCLKIALAGGGSYLWARRWVRDEDWSMLAGCLYAFSGFTVYNIFFNHFLDVVALFPYMLAALDDAVIDGKKGRFPFWVAVNLLNNYFFFAGQAVFLIIYFFCMLAGHAYKIGPRKFALLAGETLLGCAMGCVLLLPAGLSLLQNPRTIDPFNGMGYLVYGKAQQYGAIFYSAFLMPDAPYFKDMFSEGILKHTSMTAYLPVVGIAGGLAFCRGRRSHPFTYILKVCVVCAFVPILNSLFYALNSSYYARWYYMPVLVLCGATAPLLRRVAGVSAATAKNIVAWREEEGAFTSRAQLKKVKGLGPKAYEQCAGFLRLPEAKNRLDATAVHPESYPAAKALLDACGYTTAEIGSDKLAGLPAAVKAKGTRNLCETLGIGEPTLNDIVAELCKPGRDVRDSLPKPLLRSDVMSLEDLKPGMELTGTVRNVIDFGAFVDLGVHQDGLVHVSQISDKFIKHPSEVLKVGDIVRVKVLNVDTAKKRIALTMKGLH